MSRLLIAAALLSSIFQTQPPAPAAPPKANPPSTPPAKPRPETMDIRLGAWRFEAKPAQGFFSPYYLFVPEQLRKPAKHIRTRLIVLPNNSGEVTDDDSEQEQKALEEIRQWRWLATVLNADLLEPAFPRTQTDDLVYTHALGRTTMTTHKRRLRRPDLQLIAMIDDARHREARRGVALDRRVLMFGFSASGSFTSRFVFMHPDRIRAAAFGSPGGWAIAPVAEWKGVALPYPVGVADFRQVTGRPLNLAAVAAVPQFLFMGTADTNDSVPYNDSFDKPARKIIFTFFGSTLLERWQVTKMLYARYLPKVGMKLYPGIGHEYSPQMLDDMTAFLAKNMN